MYVSNFKPNLNLNLHFVLTRVTVAQVKRQVSDFTLKREVTGKLRKQIRNDYYQIWHF